MKIRFDGRVALVTGAAQGLGAAIARKLAEEGSINLGSKGGGEAYV